MVMTMVVASIMVMIGIRVTVMVMDIVMGRSMYMAWL